MYINHLPDDSAKNKPTWKLRLGDSSLYPRLKLMDDRMCGGRVPVDNGWDGESPPDAAISSYSHQYD
jgi:hypothetical protein